MQASPKINKHNDNDDIFPMQQQKQWKKESGKVFITRDEVRSLKGWGTLGNRMHMAYFGDTWGVDKGSFEY